MFNATPRPLYLLEREPVPTVQEGDGPQGLSGWVRKISSPPGAHPRAVHSVDTIPTDLCRPTFAEMLLYNISNYVIGIR